MKRISFQKLNYGYLIHIYFISNRRGGRPTTLISSPSQFLLNFSSEPPQNPRPFNIILFKCLILLDKTIFNPIAIL